MKGFSLIYTTVSNKKEAKRISQILIKEKLAGCCNIFKIDSFYWWQGRVKENGEYGIFAKTKKSLTKRIIKKIKENHSYSVPCILSFDIKNGNKDFLNWIKKSTK